MTKFGRQELMDACMAQDVPRVRELLAAGESPNADFAGTCPLYWAAGFGSPDLVQILLQAGANPNWRNLQKEWPVFAAANTGQYGSLQLLVEHGGRVDWVNDSGATPLHTAAWRAGADKISYLLDHGGSVEAIDFQGYRPIHVAARALRTDLLSLLLPREPLAAVRDHEGRTPLHECVRHLRRRCQNVLKRAANEASALAVDEQHALRATVGALLKLGDDIHTRDVRGRTVLHDAVHSWPEVVSVLLGHGADPNARDVFGATPLFELGHGGTDGHLRKDGTRRLVLALLERGASLTAANDQGETPEALLLRKESPALAAVVQAHMAGAAVDATLRGQAGTARRPPG